MLLKVLISLELGADFDFSSCKVLILMREICKVLIALGLSGCCLEDMRRVTS